MEEDVPKSLWEKYEPHYYRGMRMIAGLKDHQYSKGNLGSYLITFTLASEEIESGEFFYGLLHKRYVLTNAGISKLEKLYEKGTSNDWR